MSSRKSLLYSCTPLILSFLLYIVGVQSIVIGSRLLGQCQLLSVRHHSTAAESFSSIVAVWQESRKFNRRDRAVEEHVAGLASIVSSTREVSYETECGQALQHLHFMQACCTVLITGFGKPSLAQRPQQCPVATFVHVSEQVEEDLQWAGLAIVFILDSMNDLIELG